MYLKTLQKALSTVRDERIKLTNEVLTGMKVIKLQAWEKEFENRIREVRERELFIFRKYALEYFLYVFKMVRPIHWVHDNFEWFVDNFHIFAGTLLPSVCPARCTPRFPCWWPSSPSPHTLRWATRWTWPLPSPRWPSSTCCASLFSCCHRYYLASYLIQLFSQFLVS